MVSFATLCVLFYVLKNAILRRGFLSDVPGIHDAKAVSEKHYWPGGEGWGPDDSSGGDPTRQVHLGFGGRRLSWTEADGVDATYRIGFREITLCWFGFQRLIWVTRPAANNS